MKKTLVMFKGASYTKSELAEILGIGTSTLRQWLLYVELPLQDADGAPKSQPLSADDVIVILYAWVGIYLFHWGYRLYRNKVVAAGKAKAFEKAYHWRTGGGSLKEALERLLADGVIDRTRNSPAEITEGQSSAIKFLLEHLEARNDESSRTSNKSGKEREGNSRNFESIGTVVG